MLLSMAAVPAAAQAPEISLPASRLDADSLPEGNLIYMGTASVDLKEGDYAIYSFPIYREGDLSGEASVDIHTIDLTAVYGSDYELVDMDVKKTGDSSSLLEKYAKMEASEGEDEGIFEDILADAAEAPAEEEAPAVTEEADSDNSDGSKSLRQLKEESTGLKTRDPEELEGGTSVISPNAEQELQQAFVDEFVPEAMQNMEYSSITTVTFASGEAEKIVRFRILDDNDSEGVEGFSMLLVNPQEAELYKVTSLSVSIADDEEYVRSTVSFSKGRYTARNGKAIIKLVRNGTEQSLCDFAMLTSGDTAVAGENYKEFNDTVAFMPYETEKEIEIPVSGEGTFKVLLNNFSGCDEGKHTQATVEIMSGKNSDEDIELYGGESDSFGIKIGGTDYEVDYQMPDSNKNAAATGVILDESYIIPPEVGTYYFSTDKKAGGIFNYGNKSGTKPWGCGYWHSDYVLDTAIRDMSYSSHYGRLDYYHTTTTKKGQVWTYSDKIPASYYQYLAPNWTSTTNTWGGQLARFKAGNQYRDIEGKFDRTLDKGAIRLINESNGARYAINDDLSMEARAIDNEKHMTPINNVKFYGVAAMYKKISASITNVNKLEYLTGNGEDKISAEPLQITINSGAEKKNNAAGRDFYLNPDVKKSTLVFSIDSSLVNGYTDKFGVVKGYKITMTPENKNELKTELEYPKDYVEFVKNQKGEKYSSVLNYTDEVVDNILNSVQGSSSHLDTIPMDVYFFHWIESEHDMVTYEGSNGYVRGMQIVPIIDYIDAKVEVLPPVVGSGHFTGENLSSGASVTYHAGDTIDVSCVSDDENYRVMGYQVSVDGGKNYNTIQDTNKLHLKPNKNYRIRPYLEKNTNRVEIRFENGAENYLNIQNLITETDINSASDQSLAGEIRGKNVLNLNPVGAELRDKINPIVGEIYTLNITGNDDSDYVYRPVINHNNNTYRTNSYHFEGANNTADNIITVGYEKIARADLNVFNVSGTVVSANAPIKTSGLEFKKIPMVGYTVAAGKGTQLANDSASSAGGYIADSVSGTTTEAGKFSLSGINGRNGDLITIYISNGITNGYISTVRLSAKGTSNNNEYEVDGGLAEVGYPYGAPRPTSISYSYDKVANNQGNNNDANQIKIVDDNITLSIVVDSGIPARNIEKAVFTVRKITGDTLEYEGYPVAEGSNLFRCRISSMTENLHGGDSITVHLVDKEKLVMADGTNIDIVYPELDTGYTLYAAYDLAVIQSFDANQSPTIDVPLIGNATGVGQTGVLKFNKTDWTGNTGYTISVNASGTYGGVAAPTTEQKFESFQKFHHTAQETADDKAYASRLLSEIFGGKMPDPEQESYAPYKNYNEACAAFSDTLTDAKQPFVGFNSKVMSVRGAVVIAFDFVKMPTGDYMFACGTVAIGGSFNFNKTMYSLISNVPVFLNIQAGLTVDTVISYTTEGGKNALTAGAFEQIEGNIAERLDGGSWALSFVVSGKVQVGVGLCGVLSARGYASLTLRFDVGVIGAPSGGLITTVGGVGFDLLFFSIDIDIVKFTLGYGSLEGKTEADAFNGLISLMSEDGLSSHKFNMGTADMSEFGQNEGISLFSTPQIVSTKIILDNAAERTRPHIIPLDDENKKKMIVFIGNGTQNGKDEANASTLFYSVYDESADEQSRGWSTPTPVDLGSDTFDTTPEVERVGNKVYIAWADAGEKILESDSIVDALNKLDISGAIYDISTGTMGEKIQIVHETDNKFFDALPQISVNGDDLIISYLKRDLSEMDATETDTARFLMDFNKAYSTMVYKEYNTTTETLYNDGKEVFLHVPNSNPELNDTLVLDLHTETTEMDGETYILSTFTIDTDRDINTSTDREILLWVVRAGHDNNNLMYYPIQITNTADASESTPKLTKISTRELAEDDETVEEKEGIYLTWITDGYIFNLVEVSDILNGMFNPAAPIMPGSTTPMYDADAVKNIYKSGYIIQNGQELTLNENWYKKSAAELGIAEDVYNGSIFADLANNNFRIQSTNFSSNEELQVSIGDYVVTGNGEDLYIYYTNFGEDKNNTGRELFGVRYRCKSTEKQDLETGTETTEDGVTSGELSEDLIIKPAQWGFTKAVQITNENKVLDEIDLYMTKDNKISVISNFFEQWIDEDDQEKPMKYGPNQLAQIEFEPVSSLDIVGGGVSLPEKATPDNAETLTLGIKNNGLLDAIGYDVRVWVHNDGQSLELLNSTYKEPIPAGDTVYVDIPLGEGAFSNPAIFDGLKIDTEVKEILEYKQDGSYRFGEAAYTTQDIPYETKLEIFDTKLEEREDGRYIVGKIANNGLKTSEAVKLILTANANDTAKARNMAEVNTESLSSGDEKAFEMKLDIKANDFDHLGVVNFKLTAEAGDAKTEAYNSFNSPVPILAEINNGEEQITLNSKNTAYKLNAEAAPWKDYAGNVEFYSADNGVAVIDEAGNVTPVANGTTTLYAYYPKYGISDEIIVSVSEMPDSSAGGGGASRYTVMFDTNGGSIVKSQNISINKTVSEPTAPTKNGYKFDGWYTDKDLTTAYDFSEKVTKSFTLYAKWAEEKAETSTGSAIPFVDVKESDWYYETVKTAYEKGMMKGVSDTEFGPNTNITRGMFVTVLYRMENEPAVNKSIPFADVKADDYYSNAVIWAQQNNIVNGINDTEFAPNANITREQMVTILYRYAQYKGYDVSIGEDTNILSYTDFDKISEYAVPAMQWAAGYEIISGKGNGILDSQGTATRAEATAVLVRFLEKMLSLQEKNDDIIITDKEIR